MSEPTDERSGVEILKEQSRALRPPLVEEFASPTTHITDAGSVPESNELGSERRDRIDGSAIRVSHGYRSRLEIGGAVALLLESKT